MNAEREAGQTLDFSAAQPRDWHWTFARRTLPEVAFVQTEKLLGALGDAYLRKKLPQALMRYTAELLDKPEEALAPYAEGIRVHTRMLVATPIHVFEMPSPQARGEAHFVAVVNRYLASPRIACYLLVRTEEGGTASARIGADGAYLNLGEAPEPTLEAFLDQISTRLATWEQASRPPGTPAGDDVVGRHNLSTALLEEVLERAGYESSRTQSGNLLLREGGLHILVLLPVSRKDYFSFYSCRDFREGVARTARLECANRINSEYLYIRASVDADGALCLAQNVQVLTGVSAKYLAGVLRIFALACREAVEDHAAEMVV